MSAASATRADNDTLGTAIPEQPATPAPSRRSFRPRDWHPWLLGLLGLGSLLLPVVWLDKPTGSLIFDEFYYVNFARVILGITHAAQCVWRRHDDLSFMVLALFFTTYLPYWPAALLAQRISYIFYFLPTIPTVTRGIASFLYSRGVPRVVRWAFIGAVLLGVYGYFPFRNAP